MQAWKPWLSAAAACGGMSAAGDVTAQALVRWQLQRNGRSQPAFEAPRTARMLGFGFLWYGPFQHWWYGMLAEKFPGTAVRSFLPKVALNQVVLGPIVLTTAFAWNFWLTGRARELPAKMRADFAATLVNGWKFWVPAACANFWLIPVPLQVFFMSTCGFVWTAYLSFASYNSANAIVEKQ